MDSPHIKEAAMSIKQLNPYLNFDGTAQKAIQLYEKALGAKVENIMRFGDAPGTSPEHKDRVMHSLLRIGPNALMVSDTMPGTPLTAGSNAHVCLDFDDPQDLVARFGALAQGGQVTVPLADTFWGAKFGMLTDAYGASWMFNCMLQK
jgi:PhnB protein